MKKLKDILSNIKPQKIIGEIDIPINRVCFDSREVKDNCLFVAVKGTQVDGHDFIDKAIEGGANSIVCELLPSSLNDNLTYLQVKDAQQILGVLVSNFHDNPSSKLKLIGVTGTNGKTTVVTLLFELFRKLGFKVGLLSTVKYQINDQIFESTHTTPDSVKINELMQKMVKEGCEYCFIEVSSHAIQQKRIAGLDFKGAVFTNITHDHLDYHNSFDEYLNIKKSFFDDLSSDAFALSNYDDKNGEVILQNTQAGKKSFSTKRITDYKAKIIENQFEGLLLKIDDEEVWFQLIGDFNAYNILSVYAVARLLGTDKMETLTTLSSLGNVEGRFDFFRADQNKVGIVDYAHTPDALKNVLLTIKAICTNNENIITVVGCGGDRDRAKRPIMAGIATELSSKVILTSDNPRSEDPNDIIDEMKQGVEHQNAVLSIVDRKEAIKTACALAKANDVILVAGKGHEKYQTINGEKQPFDDMKILKETLNIT
ncbi:MAG: UDP-N-acetylmuramoyl-L-alanyl-D-glutamate--2,6-diaminopimelate ligase [Bacteroidia bacterium]|nr:UDP-N-acetylmuramoyl-L-alanyl-D-glutamate--2,6-diaminopimelate ligase [Bacteroidia bacterium]